MGGLFEELCGELFSDHTNKHCDHQRLWCMPNKYDTPHCLLATHFYLLLPPTAVWSTMLASSTLNIVKESDEDSHSSSIRNVTWDCLFLLDCSEYCHTLINYWDMLSRERTLNESESNTNIFLSMMKRRFTRCIISEGHVINGYMWNGQYELESNYQQATNTKWKLETDKLHWSGCEERPIYCWKQWWKIMSAKVSLMVPLIYEMFFSTLCMSMSQWLIFITGRCITNKTGRCSWPSPHPAVRTLGVGTSGPPSSLGEYCGLGFLWLVTGWTVWFLEHKVKFGQYKWGINT